MRSTRRAVLRSAAGASATLLLPRTVSASVVAAAVSPSNAAWLIVDSATSTSWGGRQPSTHAGPMTLIGLDSSGQQIGHVDGVLPSIFRDATGTTFVLPWPKWEGDRSTTVVELFDAGSGAAIASLSGHTEIQGTEGDLSEGLDAAASRDGRWLVVLHKLVREYGSAGPKGPRDVGYRATQTLAIELFDMTSRKTVDYQVLESVDRTTIVRDSVRFGLDGNRAYVLGRRLVGGALTGMLWGFDVGSGKLVLQDRASATPTTSQRRRSQLPDPDLVRQDWAFLSGVRKLIAYEAPVLRVYNLPTLALLIEIEVTKLTPISRLPPRPLPLFNPTRGVMHVIDPSSGTATSREFTQGRETVTRAVPGALTPPLSVVRQPREAVALNDDASRLYLADNRIGGSGIWELNASDLTVIGNWLSGHQVQAIWSAPDGTLFALSRLEDRVYALGPTGDIVGSSIAHGARTFAARALP